MSQASARAAPDALIRQELLFVTGKGGVGKSAVATAFATTAARAGRRTLLVVQQPPRIVHPQLGLMADYSPTSVESNLDLCNVDGRSALKEYVHRSMPMSTLYDWFLDTRAIKHFTEAAPGFDELMCLGKLYDLVTESDYAQVVFDAPATGHASLMLRVPRTTAAAVRSGPLHTNAVKIQRLLEDHLKTCVIVVALAEEMAVREALELSRYVDGELGIALGPTIVNRVTSQLFTAAEINALSAVPDASAALARITRAAAARFARAAVEAQHVESLRAERSWLVDVPNIVLARHDGAALIDGIVARLRNTLIDGSHD
jgi:anion-transporting  ArsA/GET3 family ATPase